MLDKERMVIELVNIGEEYGIGMIDSVVKFAELRNIDIEDVIPLLDKNVISKIKREAMQESMISKKHFCSEKITASLFG